MFPNSNSIICSYTQNLIPLSKQVSMSIIPSHFERTSNQSFLYCDVRDDKTTNIIEIEFKSNGQLKEKIVEQFMGVYEESCFGDSHALLMSKEGDIVYYDLLDKTTFFAQKQHPSVFNPIQNHCIDEIFITCGGNVKNQTDNQKIIKVWSPFQEELVLKGRVVTGHTKSIQNSIVLGRSRLVTMSTDKTIRCVNLATLQMESIMPVSMDFYSGCQMDWNSIMLGGISKYLMIYDMRAKKIVKAHKLDHQIVQISKICRITNFNYIYANVNEIYCLDIRKMTSDKKAIYQGQRISEICPISKDYLVMGNKDKTLQVWNCK